MKVKVEYLRGGKGSKDAKWLPFRTLLKMTNLTKALKEKWLQLISDDLLDPNADGSWLLDQHIVVGIEFLRFGLNLKPEELALVEPTVSNIFYKVAHEADLENLEELQATQANRLAALNDAFRREVKLIVAPICVKDHWTLLAVLQTDKKAEVSYFDSLSVPDAANLQLAAFLLKEIRPDLKTELQLANAAKQPSGTAVCGCFVMFWIEQKCRQMKGESPCSMGWPEAKTWSDRIKKLMKALKDLQMSLKEDELKKLEKDAKLEAKAKANEEKALKSKKGKKTAAELEAIAAATSKAIPKSKPCLENLSKAAQEHIMIVKLNGKGICSKCHWQSGCFMCSEDKALKYFLRKEFPDTFEGILC